MTTTWESLCHCVWKPIVGRDVDGTPRVYIEGRSSRTGGHHMFASLPSFIEVEGLPGVVQLPCGCISVGGQGHLPRDGYPCALLGMEDG